MSAILERMVRRTYGGLPSAAPLVRPGTAPVHPALPAPADDGFRPMSVAESAPPRRVRHETRSSSPVNLRDGSFSMDEIRPGSAEGRKTAEAPVRMPKPEPSTVLPDGRWREWDPASGLDRGGPVRSTPFVVADRARPTSPVQTRMKEAEADRPGSMPASETPWGMDSQSPPARQAGSHPSNPPHPSRSVNVFPEKPLAAPSAEPPPEIHITIGAIELRGPRSESKPAAFRPRVSLEELLGRNAGNGR